MFWTPPILPSYGFVFVYLIEPIWTLNMARSMTIFAVLVIKTVVTLFVVVFNCLTVSTVPTLVFVF